MRAPVIQPEFSAHASICLAMNHETGRPTKNPAAAAQMIGCAVSMPMVRAATMKIPARDVPMMA
ncbi:hypothetical protein MWU76_19005 [Gelidibacter sp. F2691]|nr:hypothetical protein [Gelidibacter sp. F2691]